VPCFALLGTCEMALTYKFACTVIKCWNNHVMMFALLGEKNKNA
jgi:hypothetical protein